MEVEMREMRGDDAQGDQVDVAISADDERDHGGEDQSPSVAETIPRSDHHEPAAAWRMKPELAAPVVVEATPLPPPPPSYSHSPAASFVSASPPLPAALASVPCLQVPGVRTGLYAFLIALGSADLVLGLSAFGGDCVYLSAYTVVLGLLCVCGIVAAHFKAQDQGAETTLCTRLLHAAGSLVAVVVVLVSCLAITFLAEGERCSHSRGLRQLALVNIVLVLSISVAVTTYAFLRYHFPELRFSALGKQAGKALVLFICLAAFIGCLANIVSMGPPRERYHFGFSYRQRYCPTSCLEARTRPSPPRTVKCFSSWGSEVDISLCREQVPHEEPLWDHPALLPCPEFPCSTWRPVHWAMEADFDQADGNSTTLLLPDAWYYRRCTDSSSIPTPRMTIGCRNDNIQGFIYARWQFNGQTRPSCDGEPIPSRYDRPGGYLEVPLPPRPCPQSCQPLFRSALLFAAVFGVVVLVLAASLLCSKRKKSPANAAQHIRQQQAERAAEDEAEAEAQLQEAMNEPSIAVAPVDSAFTPAVVPAAAPGAEASLVDVLWHHARVGAAALWDLSRVFLTLGVRSARSAQPWWRHALLLVGCLSLIGLTLMALGELMWLVNADCRTFTVSAVLNAAVTATLVTVGGSVLLVNRQRVIIRDENPFEAIGLLRRADETDSEDEIVNGGV